MGSGSILTNGRYTTQTYAACCTYCQARIDCGAFFWWVQH